MPHLPCVAHEAYLVARRLLARRWCDGLSRVLPIYPEPSGFRAAKVRPEAALFSEALGEFILPYDAVRTAADPDKALLDFLQSTYEAVANLAKWDRDALECDPGKPGVVRQV